MKILRRLKWSGRSWLYWGMIAGVSHFLAVVIIISPPLLITLAYKENVGRVGGIVAMFFVSLYHILILLDWPVLGLLFYELDLNEYWTWAGQCVLGSVWWFLIGAALGSVGTLKKILRRK